MIPDIVEIKRLCASGQWNAKLENGKILLHDTVAGETVCIGNVDAAPVAALMKPLTLDEAKELRICWIEEIDEGAFPAIYAAPGNGGAYAVFVVHEDNDGYDDDYWGAVSEYGTCWRCWSRKPTDEECRAAEWE